MSDFFQGMIATIGFLGGICGFIYWVFNLMEKRIESKLDSVSSDIAKIANELVEERRSKDYLYKFVIDNVDRKK
jgi:ATP-dependent protease HslVU (ClpYQ) peptidase subunit